MKGRLDQRLVSGAGDVACQMHHKVGTKLLEEDADRRFVGKIDSVALDASLKLRRQWRLTHRAVDGGTVAREPIAESPADEAGGAGDQYPSVLNGRGTHGDQLPVVGAGARRPGTPAARPRRKAGWGDRRPPTRRRSENSTQELRTDGESRSGGRSMGTRRPSRTPRSFSVTALALPRRSSRTNAMGIDPE